MIWGPGASPEWTRDTAWARSRGRGPGTDWDKGKRRPGRGRGRGTPLGAQDGLELYARADLLWQEVEAATGPLLGSEQHMVETLAAGRTYSC